MVASQLLQGFLHEILRQCRQFFWGKGGQARQAVLAQPQIIVRNHVQIIGEVLMGQTLRICAFGA